MITKPQRRRDPDYLEWIRYLACLCTAWNDTSEDPCEGHIDAHHVIPRYGGKTGSKVDDSRCVPLCRRHHEKAARRDHFEWAYRIDLESEILRLNELYSKLHRPVKARRTRHTRVSYSIKDCICGQTHDLPLSKVDANAATARFRCPLKNTEVEAKAR